MDNAAALAETNGDDATKFASTARVALPVPAPVVPKERDVLVLSGKQRGWFKKGAAWRGNPGGRPKKPPNPPPPPKPKSPREMAREKAAEAINLLVTTMQDQEAPVAVRIKAALAILDRGHGRPVSSVVMEEREPKSNFESWSTEDLIAFLTDGLFGTPIIEGKMVGDEGTDAAE